MSQTLEEGLQILKLPYSDAQLDQLKRYADLILKWNKVYNLTAIRQREELITHHLLDCLAVLPVVGQYVDPQEQGDPRVLDVGAGAGLPGLVWAIMRPAWQITTIDTVQKKAAFMRQAAANLGLHNVNVIHDRVEHLQDASGFDVISSRAFSSMQLFVSLSEHLLAPKGLYMALKGRKEVDSDIPSGWTLAGLEKIEVPFLPEERHLFVIKR
ncbi:MAG TPA: 16S rRNA (guanine(527)-N(7))-methyltransferase RsmG [Limnobacter sp.]|uniref:16S rRNA (guanine(527)-N(7))-methyltransferase RsmG n=1 Tax=Limnobacter sp. TaxID=2003368 RepID=UPI002E32A8F4|nr:16S rRNA (guanine(527)-N(7))-methyltransferase RsmG [Limnobacter sp.]HEX5485473.1 16S rRNA (guanine(527)-N(7))-methyltransferase RsmG [Limnobacter sp.]